MFASLLFAVVLAAEPSGEVAPAPPPPVASSVRKPDWTRRPSPDDVRAVYPPEAVKARVEGKAYIQCKVTDAGLLAECGVASEEPAGYGLGAAALTLAPRFKMKPVVDGQSVGGATVRIPIRFGGLPLTFDEAVACYGQLERHNTKVPGDEMAIPWQKRMEQYARQVAVTEGVPRATVKRRLTEARADARADGTGASAKAMFGRCMNVF